MKKNKNSYNNKAVIYARVSSREQEKVGYSLSAQIKLLQDYAYKNNLEIVNVFKEAETAKQVGRKQFGEMITYLKKNLDVQNLLAEKTDRLQRNLNDYLTLRDLNNVAIHLVKEGEIITKKDSSNQKFQQWLKVLMVQQYIDNLSEEVKKGQTEKAKEGIYPSTAPLGYLNADNGNGKRIIIIDTLRAPYVKKAFEMYASGTYSELDICNKLYSEGLRSKKGCKVSVKTFERMLKNIFYLGKFEYSGYICENAQHDAIIDEETFAIVQKRLNRIPKAKSHKLQFPYQGLIRCSICGSILSPELKKGKFIYYHCNDYHKNGCKRKSYINQSKIDNIVATILKSLQISPKLLKDVQNTIKEIHMAKNSYQEHTMNEISSQLNKLTLRLEQLYQDKCDNKIDDEFWTHMNKKYSLEKAELIHQMKRINKADEDFSKLSEMLLKFCSNAHKLYLGGTADEKRYIASTIVSNLSYHDKKLDVELFPVFYTLSDLIKNYNIENYTNEPTESIYPTNKKDPKKGQFVNGGNDEARTRDLMRDRHAL